MKICQTRYDVVVVGSGGGGLRSAISAAQGGASTLVVCRGKANRSGATLLAGANISADIACDGATLDHLNISHSNADDTKEAWFRDTVHEGFFLNNQKLVELFVNTAGDRLEELVNWGMKVRGMEGEREVSVFGSDILDTLYAQAKKLGVTFLEDTLFTDLAVEDGVVSGVVCVDIASGEIFAVEAGAVVLATGGAHNVFADNSGSTDLCGEGQAAAIRAGAEMIDMEMISFCPTVTCYPTMYKGNILPYILFSTGYGHILNKYGKTFTHRYLAPDVERLALDSEWNKMLLSYALNAEIQAGRGTRRGGLYYSMDLHPAEIMEELYADLPPLNTGMYANIMKIFHEGRSLVIKPAAHYFEGGVRIWEDMHTSLPGLFAAGECSGGLFGANRVSAATTEMLIEGAMAGKSAAAFALGGERRSLSKAALEQAEEALLSPFGRNGGVRAYELKKQLHAITEEALPVIRYAKKLDEGYAALQQLEQALAQVSFSSDERAYNREWREYLELRSMVPVAKAIVRSARLREESRGVHVRGDALHTDNERFLHNIVLKGTALEASQSPCVMTRMKPESGVWSYTGYIEQIVSQVQ